MSKRFTLPSAVYGVFMRDNQVLLLRRFNTGWRDGYYSLPAGHIDGAEKVTDALIREVKEEACIDLEVENISTPLVMHRQSLKKIEYIDFFFPITKWYGEPQIGESDKCDDLSWFNLDALPENTLRYVRHALECIQQEITFTEFGWNSDAE